LKLLTPEQISHAKSVIEPYDGRYWIAIGSKVYVFTYFPSTKISAWSIFEPGIDITDFAVKDSRIYARAGDDVYLYGGDDDEEDTTAEVVVEFPYVSSRKIASWKSWTGFDIVAEGVWKVAFCTDIIDTQNYQDCAVVIGSTIDFADCNMVGSGPAIKFKLTRKNSGDSGRISAIIFHYELDEDAQ
jgi:hypothetical protein